MCDAASSGTAEPTKHVGNDRARVTEWRFGARGDNTGWHRHGYDYVIVPLVDGCVEIEDAGGGRTRAEMKKGVAYFREAGVEHDVISANDFEFAFVEVELMQGSTG